MPDGIFIPSVTFIGSHLCIFCLADNLQTFGTGYIPRPADRRYFLAAGRDIHPVRNVYCGYATHPLPFRQPFKPLGRGAYPVPLGDYFPDISRTVMLTHPLPFRQPFKLLGRGAYPVTLGFSTTFQTLGRGAYPVPLGCTYLVTLGVIRATFRSSQHVPNVQDGVHTPSRSVSSAVHHNPSGYSNFTVTD